MNKKSQGSVHEVPGSAQVNMSNLSSNLGSGHHAGSSSPREPRGKQFAEKGFKLNQSNIDKNRAQNRMHNAHKPNVVSLNGNNSYINMSSSQLLNPETAHNQIQLDHQQLLLLQASPNQQYYNLQSQQQL